jgi:hypothetical protein
MSNVKSDLRRIANEYRDHLTAELAKVDDFIAMAERLTDPRESMGAELMLFTGERAPAVLH